jgi:hypothetical protein
MLQKVARGIELSDVTSCFAMGKLKIQRLTGLAAGECLIHGSALKHGMK